MKPLTWDDPLVDYLDPTRNYGDYTFEQIVEGIKDGSVLIEPGMRLPVLRSKKTGLPMKGTGQAPNNGVSVQQAALREFRERAIDDLPEAYAMLWEGMKSGDSRFHKLYWENLVGKVGEVRGGDAMAEAFTALIKAMDKPSVREIIIEQ